MEKKYQIFVSSTYEDLKKERDKVFATILKMNHFPIGMELFNADNIEQWEQIKRTIDSSDYYVLIIKKRYGSMTKNKISYTEKEYNYAKSIHIPILCFIASDDAEIANKDMEKDPAKLKKLNAFIAKVKKDYPCEFWKNEDELCTEITQALQNQFQNNEREGWIKNTGVNLLGDVERTNEDTLNHIRKEIEYELMRRQNDIKLAYEFWDNIDEKIHHNLKKQTYIDNMTRQIVIELLEKGQAKISISTEVEFLNVKKGIPYYSANPRFETIEQAQSYRHEEFRINGKDYLSKINTEISHTENRQFPYLVSNQMPLKYESNNVIVNHKISYILPAEEFFHAYQLVFPCRSFLTTIMLKNNEQNLYRIRTSTFSSFNVHTFEKGNNYKTEYRKGDIGTISISKWSLPGSGYAVLLQKANDNPQ